MYPNGQLRTANTAVICRYWCSFVIMWGGEYCAMFAHIKGRWHQSMLSKIAPRQREEERRKRESQESKLKSNRGEWERERGRVTERCIKSFIYLCGLKDEPSEDITSSAIHHSHRIQADFFFFFFLHLINLTDGCSITLWSNFLFLLFLMLIVFFVLFCFTRA